MADFPPRNKEQEKGPMKKKEGAQRSRKSRKTGNRGAVKSDDVFKGSMERGQKAHIFKLDKVPNQPDTLSLRASVFPLAKRGRS